METIINKRKKVLLMIISLCKSFPYMSDEKYIKMLWKIIFGDELNLDNPITFSEKLQWLKIHDRNHVYTSLVDKYDVKKYVSETVGERYVIPTIGVWNRFEDINFTELPDRFVLKCTHDSGGLVICRDKSSFNYKKAKKRLSKCLKRNFYYNAREWPYKNVNPRIIAEAYLEGDDSSELSDYKFFCFNGEPVYCQVITNRSTNETIDFFDMNWNHQEFTGLSFPHKPFSSLQLSQPLSFDEMKHIAAKLSSVAPFLRVDFYEVNGKLYFGELTFYPSSGFGEFVPDKYNLSLGKLLKLPNDL